MWGGGGYQFCQKNYPNYCIHFKYLDRYARMLLISTHNICFHGEKRKNIYAFGLKKASSRTMPTLCKI